MDGCLHQTTSKRNEKELQNQGICLPYMLKLLCTYLRYFIFYVVMFKRGMLDAFVGVLGCWVNVLFESRLLGAQRPQ